MDFRTCKTREDIINALLERAKDKTRAERCNELTNRSNCVYKAPDGRRCFVGVFIPDEPAYEALLECGSIGDLLRSAALLKRTEFYNWLSMYYDLLATAQRIHDTIQPDG